MKGRAEYESSEFDLFEGTSASQVYPWAAETGYGVGMLVGDRGVGKTRFTRNLARELGRSVVYNLDKNTLEYETLEEPDGAVKRVFVDDVHYLLLAMRLKRLNDEELIEYKVLDSLDKFKRDAKEKDLKLVYIADDSVTGLVASFDKEEHKKRFLEIVDGCVVSPDDTGMFLRHINGFHVQSENTLRLRESISKETALKIRQEFGMKDIPFGKVGKVFGGGGYFYFVSETAECLGEVEYSYEYDSRKHKPHYFTDHDPMNSFNRSQRIATIRELKVLKDEFGKVDRNTLEINFGLLLGSSLGEGWVYENMPTPGSRNPSEMKRISMKITDLFLKISERENLPLAKALLGAKSEKEFLKTLVLNDIMQD